MPRFYDQESERSLVERTEFHYELWLKNRHLEEVDGQRDMLRFVARVLDSGEQGVVEAGTGTGKTIAYTIPGLLASRSQTADGSEKCKRLVIATKTVALQDQLMKRDLPDLRCNSGLEFSFALAKGRRRYLCPQRLRMKLSEWGREPLFRMDRNFETCQEMDRKFSGRQWTGDLDEWPDNVSPIRSLVTTDHAGCIGPDCEFRRCCPYFSARRDVADVNLIVANYSLLLTDLRHEAGVFPEWEDSLVILDEAHNIPDVARQTFRHSVSLDLLSKWPSSCAKWFGGAPENHGLTIDLASEVIRTLQEGQEAVQASLGSLQSQLPGLSFKGSSTDDQPHLHLFEVGIDLTGISEPADTLCDHYSAVAGKAQAAFESLSKQIERAEEVESSVAKWIGELRILTEQARDIAQGVRPFRGGQRDVPWARWVESMELGRRDAVLHSVLLDVGSLLKERLWDQCGGAVCTSATLYAHDGFSFFKRTVGIPESSPELRIESPFDFENNVQLQIPTMRSRPGDLEYVEELTEILPRLLKREPTTLVLFTARRMMLEVWDRLPRHMRDRCLVQGHLSMDALRAKHRQRVGDNQPSCIFGLSTMGEGIDMPGDQCRHVVIVRLPFAPPDDPIFKSREQLLELQTGQRGRGFMQLSVPEATLRLKQACGRLVRRKEDTGIITILDRRIVDKFYGAGMLDALPPYRQVIES